MGTALLKQSEKIKAHAVFDYLDNRGIPINSGNSFIACVEVRNDIRAVFKMNVAIKILPYNILGDFGLDIVALKYLNIGDFQLVHGYDETYYENGNLYIRCNGYTVTIYNKEMLNLPYLNCGM